MDKIAEIKEALGKITSGEWVCELSDEGHDIWLGDANESRGNYDSHKCIEYNHGVWEDDGEQFEEADANANLIANAPEWLRYLLSELDRLKNERDYWQGYGEEGVEVEKKLRNQLLSAQQCEQKLIEGLRFYADINHYVYNAEHGYIIKNMDNGRTARIVLTELGVTLK